MGTHQLLAPLLSMLLRSVVQLHLIMLKLTTLLVILFRALPVVFWSVAPLVSHLCHFCAHLYLVPILECPLMVIFIWAVGRTEALLISSGQRKILIILRLMLQRWSQVCDCHSLVIKGLG